MKTLSLLSVSVLACALAACGKSDTSGSTSSSGAKTTAKLADIKAAYAAEFNNNAKMKLPMDQKVTEFIAKVGKPESDTGRTLTWHALDGAKCSKVEVDRKDGSITDSTVPNAECGL